MAADPRDQSRHAGQVVRRVPLCRNITIDPETARLVAAAAQAVLRASTPRYARPGRHHRLHQASQRISPSSRTPIPVHLLSLVPVLILGDDDPITLLRGCEIPSVILGVQPKLGEPRKRFLPTRPRTARAAAARHR